jgi:transposase-like protein
VAVKTYSKEFKLEAVRRMKTCKTISGLAAELGVGRRFLYKWREQLRTEGEDALARRPGQPRSKEQLAGSAKRARAVAKKKGQAMRVSRSQPGGILPLSTTGAPQRGGFAFA